MQKYKYIFQIKYKEAILSNSIWNCYGFNYQNADCSLKKLIYCVSYYNFWHTCSSLWQGALGKFGARQRRFASGPVIYDDHSQWTIAGDLDFAVT